jgi:hypothetical protein
MSLHAYVLSNSRLASLAEWQRAIDSEGLNVTLSSDTSIDELRGFLPVRFDAVDTGFECDHRDADKVVDLYHQFDFGRRWSYCLSFRCRGDVDEWLAANGAAVAYAKATGGIVFDPQQGLLMSPQQALAALRELKQQLPEAGRLAEMAADRVARELGE